MLHIDLNSKEATLSSLDFFYEKVLTGGVIIFDDYGRIEYEKEVIDKFFINKKDKLTPIILTIKGKNFKISNTIIGEKSSKIKYLRI